MISTDYLMKGKISMLPLYIIVLLSIIVSSCNQEKKKTPINPSSEVERENSGKVFELLPPNQSGINFVNGLTETEEVNFMRFQYLYNGGGVGIGDINNDGLSDVYFTGTVDNDKLYLNEGNMKFKDITLSAGILQNNGLKTGVSMVDINADGLLDIYICRSGWFKNPEDRTNLLYINQGDNTFKESAKAYGLAESGHSVQAAFFDYDKDGDLDCYIANHPLFRIKFDDWDAMNSNPPKEFSDQLYRNEGNGKFSNVSLSAGINNFGHGLGLAVSDLNQDGWPDIYVANDFRAHDYYYINNKNGTFTERAKGLMSHVSYFAMGSDAADINNDGNLDLFVVEMLAEDNKRQKTNMASMNPGLFWDMVKKGYHYQFMRNTLQLGSGGGSFSEIANLSGLTNTDWSWAPLFADFDNDGYKDLAITNGYLRDTQDKDYNKEANELIEDQGIPSFSELSSMMKSTRLSNYVFKNEGDFKFSDQSEDWGFNFSGYSNGMAYGDLDNDGDVDLIVNNFNDPASVYRNTISDRNLGHYLKVKLNGSKDNPSGLGTKLTLKTNKGEQFQEFWVVRGFHSSCDQLVHFGIKEGDVPSSIKIEWPDGKEEIINNPDYDQLLTVEHANAVASSKTDEKTAPYFAPLSAGGRSLFKHQENEFNDFENEILLPHKQSTNGPKIAVGDVNNDGLEDFYIGGAAGQAGMLIVQLANRQFGSSSSQVFEVDAAHEDLGATFFDVDNDGDQDLYVVSGGNEFEPNSELLKDRIYINNGSGVFLKALNSLPDLRSSGGVVCAADFDSDGDQDLFVGGRITPGKYPFAPRSYLLENNNGLFTDVTEEKAKDLMNPGLITSAIWTDFNEDGQKDLIVVGEWTGILMYKNENGVLNNISKENGLEEESGWWNKIIATDIDDDGDDDYVIGNLGLNYKYRASVAEPFEVYAHDFDDNGSIDIVLGYYNNGTAFPVRGRQCSSEQMPIIAEKFKTYEEFGEADLRDVYGDKLDRALHLKAKNFASSVLYNEGNGSFKLVELPIKAQFAPINGIIATDFNYDGNKDLLFAGNLFNAEVETGRADAGRGLLMLGNGLGDFEDVSIKEAGFLAHLDAKDLALLETGQGIGRLIIVANNNSGMQIYAETLARNIP